MEITPAQFEQLIHALQSLAETPSTYTITGAADWPMLLVIGGLLLSAIAMMWADLRSKLSNNKSDIDKEISELKANNTRSHDLIWEAMRNCQEDCCPRRKESRS